MIKTYTDKCHNTYEISHRLKKQVNDMKHFTDKLMFMVQIV